MSDLEALAIRKALLLGRSERERTEIARAYYQWHARTEVARKTLGFLRNPLVLAGLGIFALKMPWRRTFKLGGWAFKSWRLLRIVRRMWL